MLGFVRRRAEIAYLPGSGRLGEAKPLERLLTDVLDRSETPLAVSPWPCPVENASEEKLHACPSCGTFLAPKNLHPLPEFTTVRLSFFTTVRLIVAVNVPPD